MVLCPKLSLIVPAFNEVKRIRQALEATRQFLGQRAISHEIIVAADGTDGTREVVADMGQRDGRISVLGSAERGGKGRGIRLGVQRAVGEIIGFMDADYKTPIEELDKLLPWFDQGYDVVIGSRGISGARIEVRPPFYRTLGSRAFNLVVHLLLGLWSVRDTQCGFKFFRHAVAKDLFGRQQVDGYMYDVEILHLAERGGYRIKEVGVRWRDDGDTRLKLVAGNWRNMIDILRIRFGKKAGGPATGREAKDQVATTNAA